jgi:ADP-ribose pyrophosphatase YjhB (NUDIX family)
MLGHDWRWCPHCGQALGRVVRGDSPRPACVACGFTFFANMGVGAAVVIRDAAGRVLLVQRGPHQFGAGRWCFPCGFVEWGEDVAAAARREALEEAGVEVMLGEVVQVTTNLHEPSRPTVGVWFAATLIDPTAEPVAGSDAVGVAWTDPAELPELAFPADRALFERLVRGR